MKERCLALMNKQSILSFVEFSQKDDGLRFIISTYEKSDLQARSQNGLIAHTDVSLHLFWINCIIHEKSIKAPTEESYGLPKEPNKIWWDFVKKKRI